MSIQIDRLIKRFGSFTALNEVCLTIPAGHLAAVLGPSGSGKTTLLRIIAGLEMPDEGQLFLHGVDAMPISARHRQVGYVFQHYALFRHMTVFENVAFGLRVQPRRARPSEEEIRGRVKELLRLVELEDHASRMPSQLSGGQRQRVALARALAVRPKVLLLDEPFGALDARVRRDLRTWLRHLHEELKITSVFVTHDQEEALEVADQVVVMNAGRIEQVGTPEEVYHKPATPFVYQFLGSVNRLRLRVRGGCAHLGNLALPLPSNLAREEGTVIALTRPHLLDVSREANGEGHFRARVRHVNAAGSLVKLDLVAEWGDPVHVEIPRERYHELALAADTVVCVRPKEAGALLLQPAEEERGAPAEMYYI
jgi:sulfate transport system ATP-binding protein